MPDKKNRPNLRGFHHATILRNLAVAGCLVATVVTTVYFTRNVPRKRRFAEFYLNYDPQAVAERIRDAGLFQSCPPEPAEPAPKK